MLPDSISDLNKLNEFINKFPACKNLAMICSTAYGTPEAVAHMIGKGIDFNERDKKGNSLGYAVAYSLSIDNHNNNKERNINVQNMINLLFPNYIDPNKVFNIEYLSEGLDRNFPQTLNLLLEYGLETNTKNKQGKALIDVIVENKNFGKEIVKVASIGMLIRRGIVPSKRSYEKNQGICINALEFADGSNKVERLFESGKGYYSYKSLVEELKGNSKSRLP